MINHSLSNKNYRTFFKTEPVFVDMIKIHLLLFYNIHPSHSHLTINKYILTSYSNMSNNIIVSSVLNILVICCGNALVN